MERSCRLHIKVPGPHEARGRTAIQQINVSVLSTRVSSAEAVRVRRERRTDGKEGPKKTQQNVVTPQKSGKGRQQLEEAELDGGQPAAARARRASVGRRTKHHQEQSKGLVKRET